MTLSGRLAASWAAVLVCAGILSVVSTPGSGLPPVALPAGVVVCAIVVLPRVIAWFATMAALLVLTLVYSRVGYSRGRLWVWRSLSSPRRQRSPPSCVGRRSLGSGR